MSSISRCRPRRGGWLVVLGLVTLAALPGCSELSGVAARLSRSFVAVPDTVGPGDSVRVVLNLVNPTAQAVSFTGLYSCPAFIVVVRDAAEVELQGSKFACPAALTQFRIPAQDSLTVTYEMIARVRAVGSADSFTLAPPGVYRLRADLNMSLPDMEASITVVPSALR